MCLLEDAGQSVLNTQPTLMATASSFLAAYTDFLSKFLVVVETECIEWERRIPSRLREGKDVAGISF